MDTLKLKKAWEVALAPAKNLPMTAIMMYMSGNSLQIFSIMMVVMAFKTPLMGLMATNTALERFESDSNRGALVQVKLAYVAMQVLALALGVYKVNTMGLLPYVPLRFRDLEDGMFADQSSNAGRRAPTGWRGSRSGSPWNRLLQLFRLSCTIPH
jgi:uncharacterized protein DUF1077